MATMIDWPADTECTYCPTNEELEDERRYWADMDHLAEYDAYVEMQADLEPWTPITLGPISLFQAGRSAQAERSHGTGLLPGMGTRSQGGYVAAQFCGPELNASRR